MDTVRYNEFKHSVMVGGLPNIDNETFTAAQVAEMETICKARSDASIDFFEKIVQQEEKVTATAVND